MTSRSGCLAAFCTAFCTALNTAFTTVLRRMLTYTSCTPRDQDSVSCPLEEVTVVFPSSTRKETVCVPKSVGRVVSLEKDDVRAQGLPAGALKDGHPQSGDTPVKGDTVRRVPLLSLAHVAALPARGFLGEGSFGRVERVDFQGQDAVKKSLKAGRGTAPFRRECEVLLALGGAGGAPLLLGLCQDAPVAILEYTGQRLDTLYVRGCTVHAWLQMMAGVAESVMALHHKGFVHNDIKEDNITVSGPLSALQVHIIDLGLASRVGQPFYLDLFGHGHVHGQLAFHQSLELKEGRPLGPASDVFSVGVLMTCVCTQVHIDTLTQELQPYIDMCTIQDPSSRMTLEALLMALNSRLEHRTEDNLHQPVDARTRVH